MSIIPSSVSLLDRVATSHGVTCRLTIMVNGVSQGTIPYVAGGTPSTGASGSSTTDNTGPTITLDTTNAQMSQLTFTYVDPTGDLIPGFTDGSGPLQPTGVEIKAESGLVDMITGDVTWFPAGVFGVSEVDGSHGTGDNTDVGPVFTATCYDRSQTVSASIFTDSFDIAAGTEAGEAIMLILGQQAPWISAAMTNFAPTDFTVAEQQFAPDDDPWQASQQIAQSAGMVLYFDYQGILVMKPVPTANNEPVSLIIQEGALNLYNALQTTISNSPGYNGVTVVSTDVNLTAAVQATAWDSNPASPTYYLGPYRMRPAPSVSLDNIETVEQALAAAQGLLPQTLGLTRQAVVSMIPFPSLNPYDLVYLGSAALKVGEALIVSGITMPLDYSQLASVTLVPIGSPTSQISPLSGPGAAGYGNIGSGPELFSGPSIFDLPTLGGGLGSRFGLGGFLGLDIARRVIWEGPGGVWQNAKGLYGWAAGFMETDAEGDLVDVGEIAEDAL